MSDAHVAIERLARDYYEAWFEGDAERMAWCLHPRLAKRNIDQPDNADSRVDDTDWQAMVDGALAGAGTKDRGSRVEVTVLDVLPNVAAVRVEGGPYRDLLHVGRFGAAWRIVNILWEPRQATDPTSMALRLQ